MAYHQDRGQQHRKICLIPKSAHGTNAASAQMAGLNVIELPTDKDGAVPVEKFKEEVSVKCLVVIAMCSSRYMMYSRCRVLPRIT